MLPRWATGVADSPVEPRSVLKEVFSKTDASRQSELESLSSKLVLR